MINTKEVMRERIQEIIKTYESAQEILVSRAYGDGAIQNPFPRFDRAVMNQVDDGEATLSRYAICANTVRNHILEAVRLMEDNPTKSREHLKISANSLSCFTDIQAMFDPFEAGNLTKNL